MEIDSETGAAVQVEVDGLGRTQRQTDLSGTTTWSFGDVPEPLAVQDVDGLVTSFAYDGLGRMAQKNRGSGGSATLIELYAYNPAGQLLSSTDADGVVVEIEYTTTGLPLRTSIPSGAGKRILLSEASYDAGGRVVYGHQSGVDIFYHYDTLGRLSRMDTGADLSTSGGYVLDGYVGGTEFSQAWTYVGDRVDTETLEPVHTGTGLTSHSYDPWGRLVETEHPDLSVDFYEYDINGFLRVHTDTVGATSEWRYSDRGEVEYHQPRNQAASTFTRSAGSGGRSVQVTDPLGFTATQHTDGLGRLVREDYANGASVEYIYGGSRLTEELLVDGSGGITARRNHGYYSSTGWLASTWDWHDPSSMTYNPMTDYAVEYQYSSAGRVTFSGNQHEVTEFQYDVDGLLVEELWDEKTELKAYTDFLYTDSGVDYYSPLLTGTDVIPTVSGVGLVSEPVVTAGGSRPVRAEDYLYDGAARLVGKTTYTGSGISGMSMDSVDIQSFDLDGLGSPLETETTRTVPLSPSLSAGGNLTQWTYDSMGRPLTRDTQTTVGVGVHSQTTEWDWYDDGSLASVLTPSGQTIDYARSLTGSDFELDSISLNTTPVVTVTGRDVLGRITGATTGTYTQAFGYDNMGRLDSRTMTSSGGSSSAWTAFFTDEGQLESEQISDFSGNTWTNDYTYYEEGWLKTESRGATGETRQYDYDAGGRRTKTYVNGVLERTTNWAGSRAVDVGGVAIDYDGLDGVALDHLDYEYERDARGRVAAMYDGATGTALYEMMRDEAGRVVSLDDSSGTRLTTWGLGIGGLPWEVKDSSGSVVNYLRAEGLVFGVADGTAATAVMTDGVGSLLQVGSEAVEVGSAFGESTTLSSTDARFAFAGLEALPDAPGVQMSQQRMYDSETGRFLSPDPIGLAGGNHRTRYGSGNPTRYTDPSGYMDWQAFNYGSDLFDGDLNSQFNTLGGSDAHLYFEQPIGSQWISDSWSGSSMASWTTFVNSKSQVSTSQVLQAISGEGIIDLTTLSPDVLGDGKILWLLKYHLSDGASADEVRDYVPGEVADCEQVGVCGEMTVSYEESRFETISEVVGKRPEKYSEFGFMDLASLTTPGQIAGSLTDGTGSIGLSNAVVGVDPVSLLQMAIRNQPEVIGFDLYLMGTGSKEQAEAATDRQLDRGEEALVLIATEGALRGLRVRSVGSGAEAVGGRAAGKPAASEGGVLNLGSGSNPMKGATNLDKAAGAGVDVVGDASALPFGAGSFSEVHAVNPYGFSPVSAETARVMKPGGVLRVSGTARNPFAKPLSPEAARAAGFELVETGPLAGVHSFGIQRLSSGAPLNTATSTTTTYRRLP